MSNGRSVGVIAASIVGLIGVAVVIVLLGDGRSSQEFPAGSPEAAIQTYLEAFEDRDLDGAYSQFSTAAQRSMSSEDFERAARQWRASQGSQQTRLVLIAGSTVADDRATVELVIETTYDGGMGNSTSREERQIELSLEAGAWRIADPLVWLDPIDYYSFK